MKKVFSKVFRYVVTILSALDFWGFAIIFLSIDIFGRTDFFSFEGLAQVVMVGFGGSLIAINEHKKK